MTFNRDKKEPIRAHVAPAPRPPSALVVIRQFRSDAHNQVQVLHRALFAAGRCHAGDGALVPPPRHSYFGVLAPNALLRAAVTALPPGVATALPPSPPNLSAASSFAELHMPFVGLFGRVASLILQAKKGRKRMMGNRARSLNARRPTQRWIRARTPKHLGSDDVHVWRLHLPTVSRLPHLQDVLYSEERARACAFYVERNRHQFLTGRAALRLILSAYLELDARGLASDYGPQGKPVLSAPFGISDIQFNLSHSADWIICAIARGRSLGVDVEHRHARVDYAEIAGVVFSAAEQDELKRAAAHRQAEFFFSVWTCKEAYVKALGQGVFYPFTHIEVRLDRDTAPHLVRAASEPCPTAGHCAHSRSPRITRPSWRSPGRCARLRCTTVEGPFSRANCESGLSSPTSSDSEHLRPNGRLH